MSAPARTDMARAVKVVIQHAETARLLGVGFVPLRAGAVGKRDESPVSTPVVTVSSARSATECAGRTRDRAEAQRRLDELRERYEREAPHSRFVTDHTNIVFGEGDPCARLMFIGEAPGAEEDRTGRPFVGKAGQLLDKMIAAMKLRREDVYICNVLKTRPPGNATPTVEEARICAPYLFEQIDIVDPGVIVTLGLPASRLILDREDTMGNMRGRWHEFVRLGKQAIPVMPTYHPAFLLRSYTEENRKKVWSDLQMVVQRLGSAAGAGPTTGHQRPSG
ncbi:MAG: uracil-DNA glycosylase [Phycisphaeraceae bacterium]|nr:uracil-DNA glycosylase [Phycisphaeraceae bacterium]